jgi:hypothetical protein
MLFSKKKFTENHNIMRFLFERLKLFFMDFFYFSAQKSIFQIMKVSKNRLEYAYS